MCKASYHCILAMESLFLGLHKAGYKLHFLWCNTHLCFCYTPGPTMACSRGPVNTHHAKDMPLCELSRPSTNGFLLPSTSQEMQQGRNRRCSTPDCFTAKLMHTHVLVVSFTLTWVCCKLTQASLPHSVLQLNQLCCRT